MEGTYEEHRFSVKWYVHVTRSLGGSLRGRTFYVSRSGLLFLAPVRCRSGEVVDLEIFVRSTDSVRCKARIAGDGTPCQVDFMEFATGDLKVWNDALLNLHRARINSR